jgi:alanine racemase
MRVPKVLTIIELISKLKDSKIFINIFVRTKTEIRHSACSAASIMFPATRMDMVRVGIINMACGSPEVFVNFEYKKSKIDPLQRVIAWKSNHECKNVKIESLSGMELVSLQKER